MRSTIRLTLVGLVGLLLLAIVAVGYGLSRPESLKPVAVYLLERYTGRELEITGPLALDVSMQPEVTLERVRISNPAWASAANFFTADRLRVRIDLQELLQRRARFVSINLKGGQLHLEKSQDGANTWDLSQPASAESSHFELQIQQASVADTAVTLLLPGRAERQIDIAELNGSADVDGVLKLTGRGVLGKNPWQIDGRVGTLNSLLTRTDVDLDVSMLLRDLSLSVVGKIGDAASMQGLDLKLTLQGPDAKFYGDLLGMPNTFDGDVALNTALQSSEAGVQVSSHGHIAAYEVDVEASVRDLPRVDGVTASLTIKGPDAAVLLTALNVPVLVSGPFQLSGSGTREGGSLRLNKVRGQASDTRLSLDADFEKFPSVAGATAELEIEGDDLHRIGEVLGEADLPRAPYQLQARVEPGLGSITATLDVAGHELTAQGTLGDFPSFVGSELSLRARGAEFPVLGRLIGVGSEIPGRYEASATASVAPRKWLFKDIDLTTVVGTVAGAVTLTDAEQNTQIDIEAVFKIGKLAVAGGYFGVDRLPQQPVQATVRLQRDAGQWRLHSAQANGENFKLTASGELGRLNGPAGLDLAIRLEGGSLRGLLGKALPQTTGSSSFELVTGVRGQDSSVELVDFKLTVGENRLRVDGHLPLTRSLIGADVAVRAEGPDLAAMLPPLGDYHPSSVPFEVKGRFARPEDQVLQLDAVDVSVGSASIVANGSLSLAAQTASELRLTARGSSLSELGSFRQLLVDLPFGLDVTLTSDGESVSYTNLTAALGENDISGQGTFGWAGDVPKILLRGVSKRLRLSPERASAVGEKSEAGKDAGKLFSQTRLPFEYLSELNADIQLRVDEFRGFGNWVKDATLAAVLENGELDLRQLDYQDNYGTFAARGTLRREGEGASLALTVTGSDLDMRLLTSDEQPAESKPRYDLSAELTGSGRSVAGIAAGLNGKVLLSADAGLLDNRNAALLGGDFMRQLVDTLNPFSRTERFTKLECAVLNAKVSSGVLTLNPGLIMRTDKLNMYMTGTADLDAEQLDLSLATQPRKGIGISAGSLVAPYFKVGGAFTQPQLELDPQNAVLAAGAFAVTGGLSVIARGLRDRFRSEQNLCESFRQAE